MAWAPIREDLLYDSGIRYWRDGVWWLCLSDRRVILSVPWFCIAIYNWFPSMIYCGLQRGWSFGWGRLPYKDGGEMFKHWRDEFEYRWEWS